ncbi:MAG: dihydroorotate dehydrogenase [Candidatus Schekmanbacteria bacterium]|nr:MAG: dihydroorotate dehydrogenase [Candidatus Schekmanbacteria bacterium]
MVAAKKSKKLVDKCLQIKLAGIRFKNPVILASGTCGYGKKLSEFIDLNTVGGITTKGLSLKPRNGNPPPRIYETSSGVLNSIGLENVGTEKFIKDYLPFLKKFNTKIIANIFGNSIDEYKEVAKLLSAEDGISAIEINASCPNVKKGGMEFGKTPKGAGKLVEKVKSVSKVPVIMKLSPNVSNIEEIAKASEDSGADALSLINTLVGMAIDTKTRKPRLSTTTGGLSGPAIKPVALAMVWKVKNAVSLPIIGMGGIMNSNDVIEFMIAGASAIALGTAVMVNPYSVIEIINGLKSYCKENKIVSIKEIIGSLQI